MKEKIKKLIKEYIAFNKKDSVISEKFVDYLTHYMARSTKDCINSLNLNTDLGNKCSEAKDLYSTIKNPTGIQKKIIYFILKTSDLRKYKRSKISGDSKDELVNEICNYIKKGALGFKIGCFDDIKLFKIKDSLDLHVYEILFQVFQNANIYKKLKRTNENLQSKAHVNFYEIIKKEIFLYEKCVINQNLSKGLLGFHLGMWKAYLQLQFVNQLNECFRDNPKNPFKFLKLYEDNFNKNVNSTSQDNVIKTCSVHINDLVNEFISTGSFRDAENEFFININPKITTNDSWEYFVINYELLPYFLSDKIATKILYIGRCLSLINRIEKLNMDFSINILDSNLDFIIDEIIKEVNKKIKAIFIEKEDIMAHIKSAKDIFLFGRGDFIETLFFYIKDYNKQSNKALMNRSISFVLEKALIDSFVVLNKFTEKIDVCILDNEKKWDYLSLFCQLEFPTNIILTKEIIMKYVSIFKFLWRIKKIENLLKQLKKKNLDDRGKMRIIEYLNLIYKLYNYIFIEVIENEYDFNIENYVFIVDEFRRDINNVLDKIIIDIFQVSGFGKEELDIFLGSLENLCLSLGQSDIISVQDQVVRNNLNDFANKCYEKLSSSNLFDIRKYV